VERHQADVRQAGGRVASADDTARFLRELRQLRDGAGLGHAELAARAHYPYDSIKAAEVGPALPDLPVLSAFVRGCGGTTEEWEERWRSLTKTPSLPVSEARSAGGSAAAVAGARIGSVSQGGENPDPSIIFAALSRVAERMATGSEDGESPAEDASTWPDFPPEAAVEPPADVPASFEPDAAASLPEVPAGFEPGAPAAAAARPRVAADKPAAGGFSAAGGFPSGWDPIRVSTAWPAIPDSPIDVALSTEVGAEVPPWESAPWAEDPSTAASGKAPAIPAGWAKASAAAHAPAGAARSKRRAAAKPGGAGLSRAWLVAVVLVLLCVLAVVLAIFA
jgi:hypothetical protein